MGSLSDQRGSWAGAVLLGGSYQLGRQINRGGMGEVFEATHARLPGRYAVKILRADLLGNREAFARFCREAEVMSELRHPNVVQIYDFNTTPDGRPYFVMEHLEGRDLETRLAQSGPLPLPAAVRVVDAVASALATAHAHGIVHRDLKPSNIFLCTIDGQTDELVKVLDFGISKIRASGTLLSSPTDMLGSPAYMSPEQARGGGDVDGRSDQFALGAIAYRMLTGWDPFTGDDIASLLYQVVHEDPPPLARSLPSFWDTRALQAVLDRALAKDPDQRFGGMMELARAFEAASEQTLSHDRAGGGAAVDLGSTLIATPPPPPLRPPHQTVAAAVPAEPEIVDAPPPVRTPAPEVVRLEPRRPPAGLDFDVSGETHAGYRPARHFAEVEAAEALPVTHHRWALAGLAILAVAGIVGATGAYRRIVPVARRELGLVRPKPAAMTPPRPAPAAEVPAVSAPALPAAAAPSPTAGGSENEKEPEPAPQAASRAAAAPAHHHHHRAEPRLIDRPGSVYLSPQGPSPATRPLPPEAPGAAANPVAQPPGAAPPALGPGGGVKDQFTIAPPAPTADSPTHDLAPPPAPDREPPPAPAPPPPRRPAPGDQPMAPSF